MCRGSLLRRLRNGLFWGRWGRVLLEQVLVVLRAWHRVSVHAGRDSRMTARRTCTILSTGSFSFTFRMSRASSSVIRCSLVSLSVIEPEFAFPTPAASPSAVPGGRYFASASLRQHRPLFTGYSSKLETRTGYCLLPCRVERLPKDFRASNGDLHDGPWRRLSQACKPFISSLQNAYEYEMRTMTPNPAHDDGDSARELL